MAALEHPSTSVLETAIDWLSLSTHRRRTADRWAVHFLGLQKAEAHDGNKLHPWHLNQYSGQACGRVRFGYAGENLMVQLSGQVADDQFARLWPDHDKITRIDVAVTYRTREADFEQAANAYQQALASRADHPRSALPLLVRDGDGGSTCYVGSRRSSRLLRIYNKHAESIASRDPEATARYVNAWRVEMELHDVAAEAMGGHLYAPGDRYASIRYYLAHSLGTWGITCPYPVTERASLPTGFRRRSDRDSRLAWLHATVRPTVEWLRGSCTLEELRDILGLSDG